MRKMVGQVTDAATQAVTHPVSSLAYAAGLVRGFAASVLRVAAGEKGPLMPGHLPGPVAAPVEEDVSPEETAPLLTAEPDEPDETDPDEPEPEGIVEILQAHDPVGDPVDHSAIRATISESETLRRAGGIRPD